MRHGVGQVDEEVLLAVPLDEVDRAVGVEAGQLGLIRVELDHLIALDQRDRLPLRRPHIVAVRQAEVLVEAVSQWQVFLGAAQVPLAEDRRGVAPLLETLGDRDLVRVNAARRLRPQHPRETRALRHPPRQQSVTAGRTRRRGRIELRKARPLRRHLIQPRRLDGRVPKAGQVSPAQVVAEDHNEVRPSLTILHPTLRRASTESTRRITRHQHDKEKLPNHARILTTFARPRAAQIPASAAGGRRVPRTLIASAQRTTCKSLQRAAASTKNTLGQPGHPSRGVDQFDPLPRHLLPRLARPVR